MAGGNGLGPANMGLMTGRKAGFCAGFNVPGYMNPVAGGGFGFGFRRGGGRGYGRGYGRCYFANQFAYYNQAPVNTFAYPQANPVQSNPDSEKVYLKNQAEYLQGELEAIKSRLNDLE